MQWLSRVCLRQPVLTWVLMLALMVVGLVGYSSLGVDQFPKMDFPMVLVTTRLPGSAPAEVETDITDKIEGAVNTISGVEELRSVSSEGVSTVIVVFNLEKDVDVGTQEVRDHISTVLPNLPKDIDPPVVAKVDPDAAPVLLVTLNGPGTVRDITEIADKQVRRQIESINGVGEVTLIGGRKRQINLWLDPVKLTSTGISAAEVQRALALQNLTVPGGAIENGPQRTALRVAGRVEDLPSVGKLVVRASADRPIRLEDVATVEDGAQEESSWASHDGSQAVVLAVRKQSGENTVAVVDRVLERLETVEQTLPSGFKLNVVRDSSAPIRTSVDAVKEHLVLGAVFAALVVLIFLGNFRGTLIAALAIPTSIVGTFALMWAMDFTLNVITLLALALAVGIVIDDAIVVLENIVRTIQDKRKKPFPAAEIATREIGLAVLATTLSLMAVFLPVAFMNGIIGRFLKSFGVTMAFAIGVSLFVSFSLTPMLSARLLPGPTPEGQQAQRPWLERAVDRFYRPIENLYMVVLRWVMRHRWVVVVVCLAALASIVPLGKAVPKGFMATNDFAEFDVNVRAPEGTSLLETRLIVERIASDIRHLSHVEHTLVTIGNSTQGTRNLGTIYVRLSDPKQRDATQVELMDLVRHEIVAKAPKELRIDVSQTSQISTGNSSKPVQYALAGPDLDRLQDYADRIVKGLKEVPGAVDVDSSLVTGFPEARVEIDRERAANLGIPIADIANTLQIYVGGLKLSTFQENGETYDIFARAAATDRSTIAAIAKLTVPTRTGQVVPLSSLVTVKASTGPAQISRQGRQRQVTITANVAPGYGQSQVTDALVKIVNGFDLPPQYKVLPVGTTKETGRAIRGFLVATGMSAVFMYLILAAQFGSWLHPITIMLSLPLTVPFALASLLLFGQELSILSALGIIVLFGVVKKNAILQIDHTLHLRREGMPRHQAILEANRERLRPILMTTLAFVAGMVPLIVSKGIGAGFNRATAGVVIGGQSFSLILTLLATPVAYSLFDDVVAWRQRRKANRHVEDRGEAELAALSGSTLHPS